jgi:DNA-binding beta-propeller fold protein YncE
MHTKQRHLASLTLCLVIVIATAAASALLIACRNTSAATSTGLFVPNHPVSQSLVPHVTVIVDNLPPVQSATGIALDSTGTVAWVTEEIVGAGRLARVDLASGAVSPIATGLNQPGHFVVSGTLAFVAGNIGSPVTLVRIDMNDGTVTPVSGELGGGLTGVDVNSALTRAHVVNFGNGILSRVDVDPSSPTFKQVTQVAGGLEGPRDIVMNGTETIAYVTEQTAGRLVKVNIDPASPGYGDVALISGGLGGPRGLTLSRSGKLVYLAEEFSQELSVVDVDPGSAGYGDVTTILDEQPVRDVDLSGDERLAIVADTDDGVLVVDIDPASSNFGHIVNRATPRPLDGARGLWVNDSRTRAYVVSEFSGYLSRVVIDTASPALGQTERLAAGLDIPVDVLVETDEQTAYVARERGPTRGTNVVSRVNLTTGQIVTLTDSVGQPVDLTFTPDRQVIYVVDLMHGQVHHVTLPAGTRIIRLTGLAKPFALDLAPDGVTAYIVTEPAAPSFPPGDLIAADLTAGTWSIIASDVISGATSIVVNRDGTRAYLTQFGIEGGCTGKLSWIDINPLSARYLQVTDILAGLCGPHDLDVRADERQFYVVLVDGRKLIRVDLLEMIFLPVVLKIYR